MSTYRYCDLCGKNLQDGIVYYLDISAKGNHNFTHFELCNDCRTREMRRLDAIQYKIETDLNGEENANNTED